MERNDVYLLYQQLERIADYLEQIGDALDRMADVRAEQRANKEEIEKR